MFEAAEVCEQVPPSVTCMLAREGGSRQLYQARRREKGIWIEKKSPDKAVGGITKNLVFLQVRVRL